MLYSNHTYAMAVKSGFYQAPSSSEKKIEKLQKKALRIMSFSDFKEPSSPLFKEWKILKIKDIVEIQNCLLSYSFLKGKLPKSFDNFLPRCSDIIN